MTMVFRGAGWYADHSVLPRYCQAPDVALARVGNILDGDTSGYGAARLGYLRAAKLIFLLPRRPDEARDAYLERLARRISQACAGRREAAAFSG